MATQDQWQRRLALLIGLVVGLAALAPVEIHYGKFVTVRFFWGTPYLRPLMLNLAMPADLTTASRAALLAIALYYVTLGIVWGVPRRMSPWLCLVVHCAVVGMADIRILAGQWPFGDPVASYLDYLPPAGRYACHWRGSRGGGQLASSRSTSPASAYSFFVRSWCAVFSNQAWPETPA